MRELHDCGDCAIKPGAPHTDGCDVARCTVTGLQRLACEEDHDCGENIWTGVWPGEAECQEFGWYSVFDEQRGWMQCAAGTEGAGPNLNRLYSSGEAEWDRTTGRWVKTART